MITVGETAVVDTVRGPINASDLGVTLMHEHVVVLSPEIMANYPEGWGEEDARIAAAIEKLNALKAIGSCWSWGSVSAMPSNMVDSVWPISR